MFGLLLKKQLTETFRSYFYDSKKNKKRSTAAVITLFVLFAFLMVGILGGMFTLLSLALCGALVLVGMDWMYFLLMGGFAILLGAFGSVFNTFASLYLSKDNDLLLSMPIPEKYIILSRLANVYVLGALYSGVVSIPAWIVYLCVGGLTLKKFVCGLIYVILITVLVFVISCLLGWCIAKISLKLKNKSFFTTLLCILFIILYYVVYFRARELINSFIAHAEIYGERIKGSAFVLYKIGCIPCGDIVSMLIAVAAASILLSLTWIILKKTFLSIVTSGGNNSRVRYKEKNYKTRSSFGALLAKEFSKFVSSSHYMLNCGIGILFIPAAAIAFLIKGDSFISIIDMSLRNFKAPGAIVVCLILYALSSMNNMAAPSVSLEGKNLWVTLSLPVEPEKILMAKAFMQIILSEIPMIFAAVCCLIIMKYSPLIEILVVVSVLLYVVFSALFDSFLGIMLPNLTWTNEIYPIKQGGAVGLSALGSWGISIIFAVGYFLLSGLIGTVLYLGIWLLLLTAVTVFLAYWLRTAGAKRLTELM